MAKHKIEPLKFRDALKSWRLVRVAFSPYALPVYFGASFIWSPFIIPFLWIAGRKIYVLKKDGKIRGGMQIAGNRLRSVWAVPRRKGYGTILLGTAVVMCGCFPLVNAAPGAEGFYAKMKNRLKKSKELNSS